VEPFIEFLKTKMAIEVEEHDVNYARLSGRLNPPLETTINEIENYFKDTGYTTILGRNKGRDVITIGIVPIVKDRPRVWLNVVLFIATILTTLWAGSTFQGGNPLVKLKDLWLGIPFSFSLMAILTGHELGHYFVSRRFGMATSLPYFIPMPNFIGTFGAMIRMKSIVPDRRSLLRVGMAGPIVGFMIALPITVIGIALSRTVIMPTNGAYVRLGDSLLFSLIVKLIHPVMPKNMDLFLHPMAFAGWIGFLVTGMNLIPIGQLDGGHVAYSLLFEHRKKLYLPLALILIGFGILWPGWLIWGFLAFIMARRDPLVKNGLTPLSKNEIVWGLVTFLLLILTFTPQPIVITR
jgi:membrane-associated protease RseP (regulator of RpoE activity)